MAKKSEHWYLECFNTTKRLYLNANEPYYIVRNNRTRNIRQIVCSFNINGDNVRIISSVSININFEIFLFRSFGKIFVFEWSLQVNIVSKKKRNYFVQDNS